MHFYLIRLKKCIIDKRNKKYMNYIILLSSPNKYKGTKINRNR